MKHNGAGDRGLFNGVKFNTVVQDPSKVVLEAPQTIPGEVSVVDGVTFTRLQVVSKEKVKLNVYKYDAATKTYVMDKSVEQYVEYRGKSVPGEDGVSTLVIDHFHGSFDTLPAH